MEQNGHSPIPLAFANLEYSRQYVNGTDHFPTITVKFDTDPKNFPYDAPKLSATINITEPSQFITSQSMTIDTTGGVLDSSSYSFKLDVPGERGSDLFDATVTISIDATDKAGNLILQDVITDKEYLIIDNTPPTVEFQYVNTLNELNPVNSGKYGDRVEVTAVLSEGMWESPDDANQVAQPSLSVDPLSTEITTNIVSDKIGAKNAFSFDVNAACSGFLYGLVTGSQFVENGKYQKALTVELNKITDESNYFEIKK